MSSKPVAAVVGINGLLGKHVIAALASPDFKDKVSFPVHIVSSHPDKAKESIPEINQYPDLFQVYQGDISTGEGLTEALKGCDAVIDLVGRRVSHNKLIDAVAETKPKLFVPSEFGLPKDNLEKFKKVFLAGNAAKEYAESKGVKRTPVYPGLFTEFAFKAPGVGGFVTETEAQYYEPDALYAATSLKDVGKVVAKLIAMANAPETIPEEVIVVGHQANSRQVFEVYEKVTGKKVEVKALPSSAITDPAEIVAEEGMKSPKDFITALTCILSQGLGDFEPVSNKLFSDIQFETLEDVARRVLL